MWRRLDAGGTVGMQQHQARSAGRIPSGQSKHKHRQRHHGYPHRRADKLPPADTKPQSSRIRKVAVGNLQPVRRRHNQMVQPVAATGRTGARALRPLAYRRLAPTARTGPYQQRLPRSRSKRGHYIQPGEKTNGSALPHNARQPPPHWHARLQHRRPGREAYHNGRHFQGRNTPGHAARPHPSRQRTGTHSNHTAECRIFRVQPRIHKLHCRHRGRQQSRRAHAQPAFAIRTRHISRKQRQRHTLGSRSLGRQPPAGRRPSSPL